MPSATDLRERIKTRLEGLANEAFNPEDAADSDGYDQAEREGIMMALEAVEDEFSKAADEGLR